MHGPSYARDMGNAFTALLLFAGCGTLLGVVGLGVGIWAVFFR